MCRDHLIIPHTKNIVVRAATDLLIFPTSHLNESEFILQLQASERCRTYIHTIRTSYTVEGRLNTVLYSLRMSSLGRLRLVVLVAAMMAAMVVKASQDYGDALTKSILFFEGQRSGKIPSTQRMTWRKDSALHDGLQIGASL
ncbi:hypothetical protein ACLB2K_071236 [Fragaria x ananassa]